MSKELVSSINIDAPAPSLGDAGRLRRVPLVEPIHHLRGGHGAVGGQLTLRMQPVNGSAVTLRPTVVEVVDGQRLRWQGRLGLPRLFDADHLFTVEPRGVAGSRLVQQAQFSGLLVPFFQRALDRGTLPAFHAMNAALKDRAERAKAARG